MCNTAVTPLNNAQPWRLFFACVTRMPGGRSMHKTPLAFEQQLQQLQERGLIIDDDDLALSHFKTVSYYRLSAYWRPFRKTEQDGLLSDDFEKKNTNSMRLCYSRTNTLQIRHKRELWQHGDCTGRV